MERWNPHSTDWKAQSQSRTHTTLTYVCIYVYSRFHKVLLEECSTTHTHTHVQFVTKHKALWDIWEIMVADVELSSKNVTSANVPNIQRIQYSGYNFPFNIIPTTQPAASGASHNNTIVLLQQLATKIPTKLLLQYYHVRCYTTVRAIIKYSKTLY